MDEEKELLRLLARKVYRYAQSKTDGRSYHDIYHILPAHFKEMVQTLETWKEKYSNSLNREE